MDDGEYFQTLPENSVFIFLRSGEIWRPEGTDAVRAGKLKMKSILSSVGFKTNYHLFFTQISLCFLHSDGRDSYRGVRHSVLDGAARPDALLEDHGQSGQDHGE